MDDKDLKIDSKQDVTLEKNNINEGVSVVNIMNLEGVLSENRQSIEIHLL